VAPVGEAGDGQLVLPDEGLVERAGQGLVDLALGGRGEDDRERLRLERLAVDLQGDV